MHITGTRWQLFAKWLLSFAWLSLVCRTHVKISYCWGSYVDFKINFLDLDGTEQSDTSATNQKLLFAVAEP